LRILAAALAFNKMKIKDYLEAEAAAEHVLRFYHFYVNEAVNKTGSREILSLKLGKQPDHVDKIVERGEFSPMRRLCKSIYELKLE